MSEMPVAPGSTPPARSVRYCAQGLGTLLIWPQQLGHHFHQLNGSMVPRPRFDIEMAHGPVSPPRFIRQREATVRQNLMSCGVALCSGVERSIADDQGGPASFHKHTIRRVFGDVGAGQRRRIFTVVEAYAAQHGIAETQDRGEAMSRLMIEMDDGCAQPFAGINFTQNATRRGHAGTLEGH